MERREERVWLDVKCVLGDLRDAPGDAEAMIRAEGNGLENQQIRGGGEGCGPGVPPGVL